MKHKLSHNSKRNIQHSIYNQLPNLTTEPGQQLPKKLGQNHTKFHKYKNLTKFDNLGMLPTAKIRKRMIKLAYDTQEEKLFMERVRKNFLKNRKNSTSKIIQNKFVFNYNIIALNHDPKKASPTGLSIRSRMNDRRLSHVRKKEYWAENGRMDFTEPTHNWSISAKMSAPKGLKRNKVSFCLIFLG
ncbi:unnamed protein product [Moneuplotes crassus]|uniref:Uncharacterized protein n=1 Tax=Euplotes crassus TaxID=5936 RepID=A0AAD1X6T5_EUPCR|nr:unnamed protein product [Moneuplotes crassus]